MAYRLKKVRRRELKRWTKRRNKVISVCRGMKGGFPGEQNVEIIRGGPAAKYKDQRLGNGVKKRAAGNKNVKKSSSVKALRQTRKGKRTVLLNGGTLRTWHFTL